LVKVFIIISLKVIGLVCLV